MRTASLPALSHRCAKVLLLAILVSGAACAPRQVAAPTVTPMPNWTSTPPPKPTATPEPTAGPTSTPSAFVSFSEPPPVWLSDPTVDVLAVAIGDGALCGDVGTVELLFLNAETGEEFELDVAPARAMMWLDPHTFGLLAPEGEEITTIDLTNASTTVSSLEGEGIGLIRETESMALEELGCMMQAWELPYPRAPGQEAKISVRPRRSTSADLSLYAEIGTYKYYEDIDPFGALEVRRVGNGELVWSADPDDEYDDSFEYEFAWSPVEPSKLAVVECGIGLWDACVRQRLYIVDVLGGEEQASYPGEFMDIVWSPDGSRILYKSPEWKLPDPDQRYPPEYSGPPCILDLRSGQSECIHEIEAAHFPEELIIQLKQVLGLQWNDRGDGFFYAYRGVWYQKPDEQGSSGDYIEVGGLCHLDLGTRRIECLSDDAQLEAKWIGQVKLSPNEGFAYIQYVQGAGEGTAHGVLVLASQQFRPLPLPAVAANLDAFDSVSVLWRPSSPLEIPAAVHTSLPSEQDIEGLSTIWHETGLLDVLNLSEPGTRRLSGEVDADRTVIWPYQWCASDAQTLAENLKGITVNFAIDGVAVTPEDMLEYERESEEWSCHYWATTLSGWQSGGDVSLVVRLTFARSVHDGYESYPAGDYIYALNVGVGE